MNAHIIKELKKILQSADSALHCNAQNKEWTGYYINGVQSRTKRLIEKLEENV